MYIHAHILRKYIHTYTHIHTHCRMHTYITTYMYIHTYIQYISYARQMRFTRSKRVHHKLGYGSKCAFCPFCSVHMNVTISRAWSCQGASSSSGRDRNGDFPGLFRQAVADSARSTIWLMKLKLALFSFYSNEHRASLKNNTSKSKTSPLEVQKPTPLES